MKKAMIAFLVLFIWSGGCGKKQTPAMDASQDNANRVNAEKRLEIPSISNIPHGTLRSFRQLARRDKDDSQVSVPPPTSEGERGQRVGGSVR